MSQLALSDRVACEQCGPLPEPLVHRICHGGPHRATEGCGHLLDDHSDGMRCRTCGRECGAHASMTKESP